MPSESDIQNAIEDALMWSGYLVWRQNQGARQEEGRYIPFSYWSLLGFGKHISKGASDLVAFKDGVLLGVECKAPGRKSKVTHAQSQFLAAVEQAGGIPIVADCLEDVAPYLNRVEVQ